MRGFRRKTAAAAVFSAALLLRAAYSLYLPPGYSDPDEQVYSDLAANLLAGRGLVSNQDEKDDLFRPVPGIPPSSRFRLAAFPPLYPLFLAAARRAGFDTLLSLRLLQALLGAGGCLLLAAVARAAAGGDVRGRSAAWTAAGMMAVYPPMIHYSALLMTETLFVFLILAAVFLLLRIESPRGPGVLAAGVLAGLGALCRPTLFPFLLPAAVWLWRRFRRAGPPALYLLAAALVLLPWTVRNYLRLGRPVLLTSQGGSNLYLANNPLSRGGTVSHQELIAAGVFHRGEDEDEILYNRAYGRQAVEFIRKNPLRFVGLSFRRLLWFYHLDGRRLDRWYFLLPFWLVLFTGAGGIVRARRRGWRWFPPAAVIFTFTAVHMIFLPEGRYRLPLMPFFFIFSAPILSAAAARARRRLKSPGNETEGKGRGKS